MHYRFLVTFNKETAEDSEQARRYVEDTLLAEGFVGSDGRWGGGIADWFCLGGRWSGELSRHSWAKDITAQIAALEKAHDLQVWGVFYGDKDKQKQQQELRKRAQEIWDKAAPVQYKGIAYNRDTYKGDGYEDDAMLVTQELYDSLLKSYEGKHTSEEHADLEYDEVSPDFVGKKWLSVVDYHD